MQLRARTNEPGQIVLYGSPDILATIGKPGLFADRGFRGKVLTEQPVCFAQIARTFQDSDSGQPGSGQDLLQEASLVVLSLYQELFPIDGSERPSAEDSARALTSVVNVLVANEIPAVVFNVSTFDPDDRTHSFTSQGPEPYSVAANRLIAELEMLATELEISVVDVDGAMAELGALDNVPKAGAFSEEAAEFILEDVSSLIDESGILGSSLQDPVMRVDIPAYDRRTVHGVLTRWHCDEGGWLEPGDPLFDVFFDTLVYKIPDGESRGMKRKVPHVRGRKRRRNAAISIDVTAGASGFLHERKVSEGDRVSVGDIAAVITTAKEADSIEVDEATRRFRLGVHAGNVR